MPRKKVQLNCTVVICLNIEVIKKLSVMQINRQGDGYLFL